MYIDPIKLLYIHDNYLLFLVLYEFSVFIMHELDHCNLLRKSTVTKCFCTLLVIFEDISDAVLWMHNIF